MGALLLGAGLSATTTVRNVLMGEVGDRAKVPQSMQFGDFLFGLGAFLTPMVIGFLVGKTGYSRAILLLAMVSAVPIVMAFSAPMESTAAPGTVKGTLGDLFAGRVFWMTSLAFLFYVPLESSVAGWA